MVIYCLQAITQSEISAYGWPAGYPLTRQNCDLDQHLHRRCTGRGNASRRYRLSQVLGEDIAAVPGRPSSDHCGPHASSWLLELDPVRVLLVECVTRSHRLAAISCVGSRRIADFARLVLALDRPRIERGRPSCGSAYRGIGKVLRCGSVCRRESRSGGRGPRGANPDPAARAPLRRGDGAASLGRPASLRADRRVPGGDGRVGVRRLPVQRRSRDMEHGTGRRSPFRTVRE
jgi:hypothetical protein